MGSKILKEKDLLNIINGATLLGEGGGGSAFAGIELLQNFKKTHPSKEVSVTLVDPHDMEEGAYAAVTAGMGAPKALAGKDFTPYAVNSYNALKELAGEMGKEIKYVCPVESGGFNTFVPMLLSLLNDIPVVDADGAARAVPALDTLLLHINGLDTSPLAMADDKNNRLIIKLSDPRDASEAETIGRNICVAFGSMGIFPPRHSMLKTDKNEMELGYWIGVPFWGKGYMSEAVKEMQRHAFEDLGSTAMWCGYYEGNEKSRRCQ